jgi:hypothetical protein
MNGAPLERKHTLPLNAAIYEPKYEPWCRSGRAVFADMPSPQPVLWSNAPTFGRPRQPVASSANSIRIRATSGAGRSGT